MPVGDNRYVAYDAEPPALLTTPADHAGADLSPVAADADAALRADVRRVAALLGESLVRQQGQSCSTSSNGCAALTKQSKEAQPRSIGTGPERGAGLARRAADRHRGGAGPRVRRLLPPRQRRRAGAPGARPAATARPTRAGWRSRSPPSPRRTGRDGLAAAIDALAVRPVFTAHPTEASRRSILTKLRRVADVLAVPTAPGSRPRGPPGPRRSPRSST